MNFLPFVISFTIQNLLSAQAPLPSYYPLLFCNSHAVCLGAKFHGVPNSALDIDILPV